MAAAEKQNSDRVGEEQNERKHMVLCFHLFFFLIETEDNPVNPQHSDYICFQEGSLCSS